MLIDGHALALDSMAIMLAPIGDIQVVKPLSNGEELINKIRALNLGASSGKASLFHTLK